MLFQFKDKFCLYNLSFSSPDVWQSITLYLPEDTNCECYRLRWQTYLGGQCDKASIVPAHSLLPASSASSATQPIRSFCMLPSSQFPSRGCPATQRQHLWPYTYTSEVATKGAFHLHSPTPFTTKENAPVVHVGTCLAVSQETSLINK